MTYTARPLDRDRRLHETALSADLDRMTRWRANLRSPATVTDGAGRIVGEIHDRDPAPLPHPEGWTWWLLDPRSQPRGRA